MLRLLSAILVATGLIGTVAGIVIKKRRLKSPKGESA